MARQKIGITSLYDAEDFGRLIQIVPGAAHRQDWHAMAVAFWRLATA